jgi:hypothetical protein
VQPDQGGPSRPLVAGSSRSQHVGFDEGRPTKGALHLPRWRVVLTASEGVRLIGEGAAGYSFFILTQGSAVVTSEGEDLAATAIRPAAALGAGRIGTALNDALRRADI